MRCCRLGNCLCCGDILIPCPSSPDPDEAVGCCKDPPWADEGPSARMPGAYFPGILDADNPGPGPWLGTCATHSVCHTAVISHGAIFISHGQEPTGPSVSGKRP